MLLFSSSEQLILATFIFLNLCKNIGCAQADLGPLSNTPSTSDYEKLQKFKMTISFKVKTRKIKILPNEYIYYV